MLGCCIQLGNSKGGEALSTSEKKNELNFSLLSFNILCSAFSIKSKVLDTLRKNPVLKCCENDG